jgi:hypothetical protein
VVATALRTKASAVTPPPGRGRPGGMARRRRLRRGGASGGPGWRRVARRAAAPGRSLTAPSEAASRTGNREISRFFVDGVAHRPLGDGQPNRKPRDLPVSVDGVVPPPLGRRPAEQETARSPGFCRWGRSTAPRKAASRAGNREISRFLASSEARGGRGRDGGRECRLPGNPGDRRTGGVPPAVRTSEAGLTSHPTPVRPCRPGRRPGCSACDAPPGTAGGAPRSAPSGVFRPTPPDGSARRSTAPDRAGLEPRRRGRRVASDRAPRPSAVKGWTRRAAPPGWSVS